MVTIRLRGTITQDGKLDVDLPDDLPDGDFELVIQVSQRSRYSVIEEAVRSSCEAMASMPNVQFRTLGEVLDSGLVGSGAGWDLGDSEEWVQEQRQIRCDESDME